MGQIIAVLYCTVLYYTPLSVTDGRTDKILVCNIGWLMEQENRWYRGQKDFIFFKPAKINIQY